MSNKNENTLIDGIRFIYENIDQPLELTKVAAAVGVSLSSFKRLFEEAFTQSPGLFIRRLRLEMAFKALKNKNDSVLEIALSHGFEDQSAFARRFKKTFGFAPTVAREKFNIVNELECITLENPEIIEINQIILQSVTEVGLYFESAPRAWKKLQSILDRHETCETTSQIFIGIGHDNPHEGNVSEDKVRYSAGIALLEQNLGLEKISIPKGLYAKFRYLGKPMNLGMAYHYIYGRWNENSKIKINHKIPAFLAYDGIPAALKEEHALIYVPIMK